MDIRDYTLKALEMFNNYVEKIDHNQWGAGTPCTAWDVKSLVTHITYEQSWMIDLLNGKTLLEVGDKYNRELLGEKPKQSWKKVYQAARNALENLNSLDQPVNLSRGNVAAHQYLEEVFIDLVIHSWDLARGIGANDKLDLNLVKKCYELFVPMAELWRRGGALGPVVPVPPSADLQTKLLAISGRSR